MVINGREIGFLYTVGAYCELNDYVVAHPDVSAATANLYKATYVNKAYNDVNGIEGADLTVEELRKLPAYEMITLMEEMKEAEEKGSIRTVEAQEKKQEKKAQK